MYSGIRIFLLLWEAGGHVQHAPIPPASNSTDPAYLFSIASHEFASHTRKHLAQLFNRTTMSPLRVHHSKNRRMPRDKNYMKANEKCKKKKAQLLEA